MTISQKALRLAQQRVLEIAKDYAETCADCEYLRINDTYPNTTWTESWARRTALLTELIRATFALTDRPTGPSS